MSAGEGVRYAVGALALLAAALAGWFGLQEGPAPSAPARAVEAHADLDHLIFALSWSPSYCAEDADPAGRDRRQCERPYGFIVHGLWPEFSGPQRRDCPTDNPRVPQSLGTEMADLVPSVGLLGHQWRKHGACTGLGQAAYFALMRKAAARVAVPPAYAAGDPPDGAPQAVEAAFLAANPGLEPRGIDITCSATRLREVRICLTPDLDFTACRAAEPNACRARSVVIPPPR